MITPKSIVEDKKILIYLTSRNIVNQYKKAKDFLLSGVLGSTDFKERKPQGSNIWSFRINRQFRAFGTFDEEGNLRIFEIDDHS